MNAPQVNGDKIDLPGLMLRLCLSNNHCRYLQTYMHNVDTLTQCSIVANIFDRVCAYLFQFKAFRCIRHSQTTNEVWTMQWEEKEKEREWEKEKRDNCAHVEKSAIRITKTVSQWGFCQMITHTNHFESSAFL